MLLRHRHAIEILETTCMSGFHDLILFLLPSTRVSPIHFVVVFTFLLFEWLLPSERQSKSCLLIPLVVYHNATFLLQVAWVSWGNMRTTAMDLCVLWRFIWVQWWLEDWFLALFAHFHSFTVRLAVLYLLIRMAFRSSRAMPPWLLMKVEVGRTMFLYYLWLYRDS